MPPPPPDPSGSRRRRPSGRGLKVLELIEDEVLSGLRTLVDEGARRLLRGALGRAFDAGARQQEIELAAARRSSTEANNANLIAQQELVRMQGIFEELQAAISFVEEERDELRLEVMRYREAERQEVRAKSQAEFAAVRAASTRPPKKGER